MLIPAAGVTAQSLEWQRNPATGHWYAIVEGLTWADGEAYAIQMGGHLATINDRAEDLWISVTFPDGVVIGFNDIEQEGLWVWASGEPVTYTNWAPDEPTDDDSSGHSEDIGLASFDNPNGKWAWNDGYIGNVDRVFIEVVSPVAPPAEMATPTPAATPTEPPPSLLPSPSPAASASPQASTGPGGIGSGGPTSGGGGYRQPGTLVPGITTTIPGPADVSADPSIVGANLLLAALVMVMLTIATELLNRSLGDLEPMLSGRFAIVGRLQRAIARLDAVTIQRLAARRHRLVDAARLAGIAAFYGFAFAFLDPTWDPLTVPGAWLVVMMAIAVGVVGLGGDIAAWAVGRRWGVVGDLEIRAGSLLAAVGSTLVSRAMVLVPGIMIGSPEVIEVDPDRVDRRRLGTIAAVGVGTVLLIGLASWGLLVAISSLRGTGAGLDPALGGVEAFLLLVFAFAVQNGFVQLLSLRQSGGLALRRTHPIWWGVALLLVTFTLWHTLVNPTGDLASAVRTRNVLAFLVAAGLVLFASLAVWVGTRLAWLRLAQPVDTAAVRAIDLQHTFRLGPKALAEKLGVDTGLAKALRWYLGIEADPACRHDFVFGSTKLPMYSDKALERMREAIAGGTNLNDVRRAYQAAGRP
ncbi:MAG TPA: C-type lectin domain-containing protein [Candidatus Limnocylindria bacterium]|nr:C-type lectin domain-containing protein [Candidatus Limnocylindria bacterium]